ncbi:MULTISPECIES: hypothetical protein [unclassified Streptomyces]|uniref:hypothetical protein n=1 Tax=unclassified Streptomyces TaxID=2593676 RepID=UPI000DC5E521|nr:MULTISPECIES: hypothetical protein [unclassified Streptomyces]RAJ63920.1 hypothetical protein K376_01015 [Streptomyces sp. PsTaAH-130]
MLIAVNGIAGGVFASPDSSAIMGSVPPELRDVASGMRATLQNSGSAVPIGVFLSLMIAGLAHRLPHTLAAGLHQQGVPAAVAARVGVNPVRHLPAPGGALARLTPARQHALTGREFFPKLISGPFHSGLVIVFAFGTARGR